MTWGRTLQSGNGVRRKGDSCWALIRSSLNRICLDFNFKDLIVISLLHYYRIVLYIGVWGKEYLLRISLNILALHSEAPLYSCITNFVKKNLKYFIEYIASAPQHLAIYVKSYLKKLKKYSPKYFAPTSCTPISASSHSHPLYVAMSLEKLLFLANLTHCCCF